MSPSTPAVDPNQPVIARGGTYYRNTRYTLAAILFLMAGWFAYDGWSAWPKSNARWLDLKQQIDDATQRGEQPTALLEQQKDITFRSDLSIALQKILAIGLPLAGIGLIAWTLHNSRGEIKLTADTLEAPGHPPVKLDDITGLDKRLWDRKDIAFVLYERANAPQRIRLDAFVYQTDPIVKIYERIEALMKEESESESA